MNKITITYTHDYENDTVVTYWANNKESHMTASYTSEDPDYGTDSLEFNASPAEPLAKMARNWLEEFTEYLNSTNDGINRPGNASKELEMVYGDYSNSTLYAIENALRTIVGVKPETPRFRGKYMTIADASKMVASELVKDRNRTFAFCEAMENDEEEPDHGGWHGIKRIDGFFDNDPEEFIVAVGYYGGGSFSIGYVDVDGMFDEYVKAVRRAICNATGFDADNMIYIEEDE